MAIGPDQIVTIHFTIKDKRGAIVDSTQGQAPYSFMTFSHQMFPKIEEAIGEMKVGDKITLMLSPKDAYGEYRKDAVKVVSSSEFPKGVELKEGMTFLTMRGGHETPVTVKRVEGEEVTIDYNHPMAGETVSFDVELLDVRDATPDDFEDEGCHEHGCGCGH